MDSLENIASDPNTIQTTDVAAIGVPLDWKAKNLLWSRWCSSP